MEYNYNSIEKKWQEEWKKNGTYKVSNNSDRPKYYVLDMFPYPSGAGLHVGHPLGYIASDIYSRYKRLKGFNVLHPMGFDSFGLPAEQYAIETGQHPAETTQKNIATFKAQLDKIGFCYDWDREVRTSDASYYKWTQWIFLQIFNSYFDKKEKKAKPIDELEKIFESEGCTASMQAAATGTFTAGEWENFTYAKQQEILMEYRLAFSKYGEVNWCEGLGTVLANDEVVNGVSERGGFPVVKKKMRQWYLRITDYADRLLEGLETVDFSDSMKEMQRNWIGKSVGAEITFEVVSEGGIGVNGAAGADENRPTNKLSAGADKSGLTPNPSSGGEGSEGLATQSGLFQTADKSAWTILKDLSRENRKNKTEAEDILWQVLRNNQLGYKVRRQHVIDGFIIDFAYLNQRVLIEVDGEYHNEKDQQQYDAARKEFLTAKGYTVLRFSNDEVITDVNGVIAQIQAKLDDKHTAITSTPLSDRRGAGGEAAKLTVYTTRPDTIFGVDFMVVAPELELVQQIKTPEQAAAVDEYIAYVKSRSDVDRMAEKKITGCFTGAYAINPFDGKQIPIWISEYVLAGYGTGAIMAVPCGDERDFKFAKHFNIPISNIIGSHFNGEEANATKEAVLENSGFLNGVKMMEASEMVLQKLEEQGIGKRKVNYRMRDAGFSRQRYWGEPFPIVWSDGVAIPLAVEELPLELPHVDKYGPGPEGEGPLANITEWVNLPSPAGEGVRRETSTMPGYAGSSWYFLRYMDPHNNQTFCDRKASDYWNQVDLYIGGTEHAVGHLLYSRLWTKVLFDLGLIGYEEPFKKLLNQGMIQGVSEMIKEIRVHRELITKYSDHYKQVSFEVNGKQIRIKMSERNPTGAHFFISKDVDFDIKLSVFNPIDGSEEFPENETSENHAKIKFVDQKTEKSVLNIEDWIKKEPEYKPSVLIFKNGYWQGEKYYDFEGHERQSTEFEFQTRPVVEKMSKSKHNTVSPYIPDPNDYDYQDAIVTKYGADTFRMYEMFLGPVEASKPWDTKGIEGVHRFLRKLWRLFFDEVKGKVWKDENATDAELKILHKTIKKIEEDTERFSFNTAVSTFMICVNDLADIKCHKKEILEKVLILLTPYAPHIAEELWQQLGNDGSILDASYPVLNAALLVESSKEYPVSINGKLRTNINLALDMEQPEVEKLVLENEIVQKWLEGKDPRKIIYVRNKMVNVVV